MPYTPDTFSNNGVSAIAGGAGGVGTALNAADTSVILNAGDGVKFPTVGYFTLLFGTLTGSFELARATARTSDTCTIVRGQEGTTALTWAVGTPVQQVASAANFANLWAQVKALPFNVRLYGAAGNGTTDDTAAIQTCLDAARQSGGPNGGSVYFPSGTYLVHLTVNPNVAGVSAALHIGSNTTIYGDGPENTVIKLANNSAIDQQRMVSNWNPQATGTDHTIRIRDMTINGNAVNQASVTGLDICDGIHLRYVRDVRIENVISKNNWGTTNGPNGPGGTGGESRNILCWFCADVVYLNCEATEDDGGNTSGGLAAYNSYNVHMEGCTVHDITLSYGIAIFECTMVMLTNCSVYGSNSAVTGYIIEVSNQVTLAACHAGGVVGQYGPAATYAASTQLGVHSGFEFFGCAHVLCVDCISLYASVSAFQFIDATTPAVANSDITLIGCMGGYATSHGFSVSGTGYDYTFIGCTAFNNTSVGFLNLSTGTAGQFKYIGCRALNNATGFQINATPVPYTNMRDCEALGNTTQASLGGVSYTKISGVMTAPAVPATTVALTNPFQAAMTVVITGGTVTVIAVDGTTVLTASPGTVRDRKSVV